MVARDVVPSYVFVFVCITEIFVSVGARFGFKYFLLLVS